MWRFILPTPVPNGHFINQRQCITPSNPTRITTLTPRQSTEPTPQYAASYREAEDNPTQAKYEIAINSISVVILLVDLWVRAWPFGWTHYRDKWNAVNAVVVIICLADVLVRVAFATTFRFSRAFRPLLFVAQVCVPVCMFVCLYVCLCACMFVLCVCVFLALGRVVSAHQTPRQRLCISHPFSISF